MTMDFIKLFNEVAKVAKPMHPDFDNAKSLEDKFMDIEVDSLDCLIIGIYLCEIYGISEELGKTLNPQTLQEMYDFLMLHKTKEPESIEAVVEAIQ
jgi:acyl carrier protein